MADRRDRRAGSARAASAPEGDDGRAAHLRLERGERDPGEDVGVVLADDLQRLAQDVAVDQEALGDVPVGAPASDDRGGCLLNRIPVHAVAQYGAGTLAASRILVVAVVVGQRNVALLDADPELGAALAEEDLAQVRRLLVVPVLTVEAGAFDVGELEDDPSLGLLVLDGLVTVNITLQDRVASDLAGPGDVLHTSAVPEVFLPVTLGHVANEPTRLAVLDRRFIAAARRWPALLLALHERLRLQERRHAVHAALGKLPRVEDRVLALLWHLAERWGRVTSDGVVVPLALTHEALGRLAGAARPTISLALAELARTGAVTRRDDGAFVLSHASREVLEEAVGPTGRAPGLTVVRTADAGELADAGTAQRPGLVDIATLRRRIAALHDELPERARGIEEALATAKARNSRSSALRAQVAADRESRRGR